MALSKSSYNYNRVSWEDSEFPILCQTCLGDNPYLRMIKDKYGSECKICNRPFTTFRWCPGKGMRYKKTEVCQTCAKMKNVCQTCLFDLEYGLPVQVRDYALQVKDDIPKMFANKDYYIQNVDRELSNTDGTLPAGKLGRLEQAGQSSNELLAKLARTQPYYNRNRPHICSFWVKGECKRGEECPYRHEKPSDPDDPLSDQKLKDRFFGTNDPVADKLMNRAKALPTLKPPDDKAITTLYVGNLGEEGYIEEDDLRSYFYQFGELRNVTLLPQKGCAFIQFTLRQSAEAAAEKSFNKLQIKGRRLTIRWGRPHAQQGSFKGDDDGLYKPVPGLPPALPKVDFFNLSSAKSEKEIQQHVLKQRGPKRSAEALAEEPDETHRELDSRAAAEEDYKRSRAENPDDFVTAIPPPASLLPGYRPQIRMIVPRLPFINPNPTLPPPPPIPGMGPARSHSGLYYPSQDPQRLGSKKTSRE